MGNKKVITFEADNDQIVFKKDNKQFKVISNTITAQDVYEILFEKEDSGEEKIYILNDIEKPNDSNSILEELYRLFMDVSDYYKNNILKSREWTVYSNRELICLSYFFICYNKTIIKYISFT